MGASFTFLYIDSLTLCVINLSVCQGKNIWAGGVESFGTCQIYHHENTPI